MIALIDADILVWEIGMVVEYGKDDIPTFDYAQAVVDGRIRDILTQVDSDEPPVLFLTGKGNFREEIAKTKAYKDHRKEKQKPFHYENIRQYFIHSYKAVVVDGMEADDALAIVQTEAGDGETVICTRDKDLLQVQGWHYGWESGLQGEQPLHYVTKFGRLKPVWKETPRGLMLKTLKGEGAIWFYAQMLMGDSTDNIPGCPGIGPGKAHKLLGGCSSEKQALQVVWDTYFDYVSQKVSQEVSEGLIEIAPMWENEHVSDLTEAFIIEQGRLLWMVRGLNDNGKPIMWEFDNDCV